MTTYMPIAISNWLTTLSDKTGISRSRLDFAWDATSEAISYERRYDCVETWAKPTHLDHDLLPDWRLARAILRHTTGGVGDPGRNVRITQVHTYGAEVPAGIAHEGVAYRESFDGAGITLWADRVPLCLEHNRAKEIGLVHAIVVEHADTQVVAELHPTLAGDTLLAAAVFGDEPVEASWSFISHATEGRWVEERSAVIRERAAISEVSIVARGVRATTKVEHVAPVVVAMARSQSIPRGATSAQLSMLTAPAVSPTSAPPGQRETGGLRHGERVTGAIGQVTGTGWLPA